MDFMRRYIQNLFAALGVSIRSIAIETWRIDKEFVELFNSIKGRTLVSSERCFMIWQLSRYADGKDGEAAEVGVYKGGTAKIIAKGCAHKKVYLFDTFNGMPPVNSGIDTVKKGYFSDTSVSAVEDFLKDCNNVCICPGFFPNSAETIKDKRFSFVHVDVDIYTSVRDCLSFFFDRMVVGGVMMFDDWGFLLGVNKSVAEFLKGRKEIPFITASGQCAVIKL